MMADTEDVVADDGQSIAATETTIGEPGPPEMAVDAIAHEGDKTNNNEGMKVSPTIHNPCPLFILMISRLTSFHYRISMLLRELSSFHGLPRTLVYCKLKILNRIVGEFRMKSHQSDSQKG